MLSLVRELIALRRELGDGFELLDAADGVVAFRRGAHTVAINTTSEPLPAPLARRAAYTDGGRRGAGRDARSARRSDCGGLEPDSRGVRGRLGGGGACTDDICSPPSRS